jgi:hypothetical protein
MPNSTLTIYGGVNLPNIPWAESKSKITKITPWNGHIPSPSLTPSPFQAQVEFIQTHILKGEYIRHPKRSIRFKLYESEGKGTLFGNCPSYVVRLSPLIFYLKDLAKLGDHLILEEPEMNLHPFHQRLIARALAQIVNVGLNVTVTTHSPYFLREINNLIMLYPNPTQGGKWGYALDEKLDPARVKAYEDLKALEMTDEGIIAETFDAVIENLNQSSDYFYYSNTMDENA